MFFVVVNSETKSMNYPFKCNGKMKNVTVSNGTVTECKMFILNIVTDVTVLFYLLCRYIIIIIAPFIDYVFIRISLTCLIAFYICIVIDSKISRYTVTYRLGAGFNVTPNILIPLQ